MKNKIEVWCSETCGAIILLEQNDVGFYHKVQDTFGRHDVVSYMELFGFLNFYEFRQIGYL